MKYLLYGISMILMGIVGLIIAWMGETQIVDIIGAMLSITGFVLSTYGFFKSEK